jgi:multiple sugar transport system substrate-binding protein
MLSHCRRLGTRFLLFVLLCLCLLLPIGCDSPPALTGEKAAPHHQQGGQLTIMVAWTQEGAAKKLAQLFYEETGTVVRIIKVEYHDLLADTLKDNKSPHPQTDVYQLWYAHLGRLAEEGAIIQLEDFYGKYKQAIVVADLIPHFFDSYTLYRNKRWAVPFDGDIHVLFYRKSLLAKHSLTPPRTWQEYLKISRYITEHERENRIYGAALIAHPTPILIIASFLNRLGGFGGKLTSDNQEPQIDTPEAVAALEAMVTHARYALPTPLETDFAVARDAFLQGKVAMVEQWTDIGIMADDPRQSIICGDWGVVPIPMADKKSTAGVAPLNAGWSLAISSASSKRELAEQFLAFSIRRDITLQLNLIPGGGGLDPIRKSTIASPEFQAFAPQVSRVEAQLLDGSFVSFPNHPSTPDLLGDLTDAIVAALEGRLSPSEALKACQEKWDSHLKRWQ